MTLATSERTFPSLSPRENVEIFVRRALIWVYLNQVKFACWVKHRIQDASCKPIIWFRCGSPQTNSEELNAMQLLDCGWKLPIRTKISKKILISELLISSPRKKGLNKVIKRLSTLRNWMLPLSFNILCEGRRNRNRKRKRILVSVWKFYHSTQLRRRKSTGRDSRCFA